MFGVRVLARCEIGDAPVRATLRVMPTETEAERGKRHRQRTVFDAVAGLYDAARPGYPVAIVDRLISVAQMERGSRVLEVGCGTGQLTRQLVRYGYVLTAIDPGPSLLEVAGRHFTDDNVDLQHAMFEDFDAPDTAAVGYRKETSPRGDHRRDWPLRADDR